MYKWGEEGGEGENEDRPWRVFDNVRRFFDKFARRNEKLRIAQKFSNIGKALGDLSRYDEALKAYGRCLEIQSNFNYFEFQENIPICTDANRPKLFFGVAVQVQRVTFLHGSLEHIKEVISLLVVSSASNTLRSAII